MNYRTIPIGYSHADVAGLRPVLQNYLACGDPAQAIDFFGLNAYEWCGASSYDQSGYHALYDQTVDYPVPIFFSETGCIVPRPRLFTDQTAIFGPMADVWSGAIIYEWIEESNAYGLITYSGDTNADAQDNPGYVRSGTPTPMVPDFANLQVSYLLLVCVSQADNRSPDTMGHSEPNRSSGSSLPGDSASHGMPSVHCRRLGS